MIIAISVAVFAGLLGWLAANADMEDSGDDRDD
jgi:hypothetical protein